MQKRFQVNELIGEYRVTHFLGEGGMGEVYLGVHEKLGRPAAIKLLRAATSDPTFKTRFFNEARLQASLQHPNIATLYDFQEQGAELLIFMEYVDGESLSDLIARRAFSVDETLTVFASVCEAVGYIHRNGVVHRDIKSQNVKLSSDGAVKLLDFGIAKDAASHGMTQTGGVIGTPNYLSPEQLDGKPATPQADVWALGVLLYEMLTGILPFRGDSLAGLVLRITTAQFISPEDISAMVPREAANIVKKCLKRDIVSRYQSVDELLRAVRTVIGQRQVNVSTTTLTLKKPFGFRSADEPGLNAAAGVYDDSAAQSTKSSPMIFIACGGAVVFVLLVAVVGFGIWAMGGDTDPARSNAPGKQNTNTNSSQTTAGKGNIQRIRIDMDEGKAEVLQNGKTLGTTPFDMDVVVGDSPNVTLHRDGYEDKDVKLEISSGKKVFTFSLKPKSK